MATDMSKEVMKLALEFIDNLHNPGWGNQERQQAITALREALAEQPAQQEPVAHRDGFWCADLTCKKCYSADFRFKHKNSVVNESLTTPAQRTWVGLTDEEIYKIANDVFYGNGPCDTLAMCRAIEAKLKQKNT